MKKQSKTYFLRIRPAIPGELVRLQDIAENLWFSWNSRARTLFYQIDPSLWHLCGKNPKVFLQRVSQNRFDEIAMDRSFLAQYNSVVADFDSYLKNGHNWFSAVFDDAQAHSIAYFSAEFGLHESLPIYSGGLGILAGDHCKSASDLGLPFTAVGLLYRQGFFTQSINVHGQQIATYHNNDFSDLCVTRVKDAAGDPVQVPVEMPDCVLDINIWQLRAGTIRMLLLDADVATNPEEYRKITDQLYGGGLENRIRQEIVLGVGGVRALRAMDIRPTVWHANEGHAAFIIIERMHELVVNDQLNFLQALEVTAAATVFTTHTPVPAGHDIFSQELFQQYMGHFATKLRIGHARLYQLGQGDFGHGDQGFNQTALAIRGSSFINGVAKLHGQVSSTICQSMWPDLQPAENPITSLTNGVHVSTWLAPEWLSTFNDFLGGQWQSRLLHPDFWEQIKTIPDYLFWSIHQTNKQRLLQNVRKLLEQQTERNGESMQRVREMTACFDVRNLVIGFARRFATYKRATLLFQDENRLLEILQRAAGPVLFLFAGKAHPADQPGQDLIRKIHEISRKPAFAGRILMLEGYDISLARYLTSGVDLWMNNPIRPMEASGTSGMKAAMNGVPNFSILDGWWPEGYQGDNGWAIGGERQLQDLSRRDVDDAASLYDLLEREVIPRYYTRNESGFSEAWVYMAKRAMISSIPHFNTDRMVSEYTSRFYVPASRRGTALAAGGFARAKALSDWKQQIRKYWPKVRLENLNDMSSRISHNFGDRFSLRIKAYSEGISVQDLTVEVLLFRPKRSGVYKRHQLITMTHEVDGVFTVELEPDDSGDFGCQVRVYPSHPDLVHPLSMGLMTYLE
ncbi:MAG TPA: alpha-glucan family phosphorylase [Gammaproteobacteria bacterium]|nr:alpha-glucan family phosphorylase [Gammaproteobacteria bacterium]